MHEAADGSAFLDRDDRHGFGPETITIDRAENAALYAVYIVDYSNKGSNSSRALSQSGAVVRVYGNGRLLNVFAVPENRQGTMRRVCRISGGRIQGMGEVR